MRLLKAHFWIWIGWGMFIFGCGSPATQNPANGRNNSMVIHFLNDPQGLNPITSFGANATEIQNLIFDRLIALDMKTLALRPQLAEAMPNISADRKTMTFQLRPNLKFSDGHPLTAYDVEFSFKTLMNPYVQSAPKRAEMQSFVDCQALDHRTIVFHLEDSGPFALNRLATTFLIIPQHVYDPDSLSNRFTAFEATLAEKESDSISPELQQNLRLFAESFAQEKFKREAGSVLGSGRYILDSWITGQQIRLLKNPYYWNHDEQDPLSAQNMDSLVFRFIPNVQTAFQALRSGEIDLSDQFTPEQYSEKMTGKGYEEHFAKKNVSFPYYEYVGWNTRIRNSPRRNFFADRNVRMAMSHLVNVEEIIENILQGTANPIVSMVYSERPEHNQQLKPILFNEERAKALLFDAGWTDNDGDGILDKIVANEKVDFEFVLNYRRGNELRERIARHIAAKAKRVGIKVNTQDLEWSVMLDRMKKHELDAWLAGWVYDSDEQDLFSLFHSSQILNEGYNYTCYSNPEADMIMQQIVLEWDQEKRFNLHRRIQQILYDDQPYTLLFANSARFGYNKRLQTDNWYGQRPCYNPAEFYVGKSPN